MNEPAPEPPAPEPSPVPGITVLGEHEVRSSFIYPATCVYIVVE